MLPRVERLRAPAGGGGSGATPRPRRPTSSALRGGALRRRGRGPGAVERGLDLELLVLGEQGERLVLGQLALAGLTGRVGGQGEALVALRRVRVGERLVIPRAGRTGVVAQGGVGLGGQDGQAGIGGLDQGDVALPRRGGTL